MSFFILLFVLLLIWLMSAGAFGAPSARGVVYVLLVIVLAIVIVRLVQGQSVF